ncbi:MAG: SOS response-associated peptidase [Steroidobacteraceae bacterium]
MCRRFVSPDAASIEREFNLQRTGWQFPANFNAAPLQAVPAVRASSGKSEGVLLRWGLGKSGAFNAPIESLATGAGCRASWKQGRRCIIPALGFYEWHVDPHRIRRPFYVHVDDQDVFGFAGLWERTRMNANAVTESCTIITMAANPVMSEIDNIKARMPAILRRGQRDLWLFGAVEAAGAALAAYANERTIAYAVGSRVDSPRNNDETLLEPLQTDVD